jgi:ATP-dependent Clp protease ATP-binding subunit ClpC
MYERLTGPARDVLLLANQQAQRLHHDYVDTEDVLLALIETSGVATDILKSLGVDLPKLRLEVEQLVQSSSDLGKQRPTPRAKRVIEYSMEEQRNLGHSLIGTGHILLGLLRAQDGIAARVLTDHGLKVEDIRAAKLDELAWNPPG